MRRSPGLAVPLFDRLAGLGGAGEPAPSRQRAAAASVARELGRLFNTRAAAGGAADTVTGYGVRDWSTLNPSAPGQLSSLAETLAEQVRRFEPRLGQVRIHLTADPRNRNRAHGLLEATAQFEWGSTPVRFALSLDALRVNVEAQWLEALAEIPE